MKFLLVGMIMGLAGFIGCEQHEPLEIPGGSSMQEVGKVPLFAWCLTTPMMADT